MAEKKDRFNMRRYSRRKRGWYPSSEQKRWSKPSGRRYIRTRNRQRIREGELEDFVPYWLRWGWL